MTTTDESPRTAGYALDSAWHAERDRLNSITRLYDPGTLEVLETLGVSDGWQCLDVGAGTGSLAETLAGRVAPSGSVLALDIDTRFLEPIASEHLHVGAADVTADPLPEARFDLVHARLLLEHLTEREHALSAMVAATRPGGWVVIEDFDWATALVIDPPSPTHDKVATAIMTLFARHGYAPTYGRTLPRRLRDAGLLDVGTRAQAIQVWADREHGLPQWELLADQLTPGLLAAGLITPPDLEDFHALWHDGATACFAPLMVSCYGRRPATP